MASANEPFSLQQPSEKTFCRSAARIQGADAPRSLVARNLRADARTARIFGRGITTYDEACLN
jgi:hypothetical protein